MREETYITDSEHVFGEHVFVKITFNFDVRFLSLGGLYAVTADNPIRATTEHVFGTERR